MIATRWALHRRRQSDQLEQEDAVPAEIDLPELPSELRGRRRGVMILVPVLALKKLERREPSDVLRRVFAMLAMLAHVRDDVDEALRVKRHHETHRAEPEKCRKSEGETAKERDRQHRDLDPVPEAILRFVEIR